MTATVRTNDLAELVANITDSYRSQPVTRHIDAEFKQETVLDWSI